MKAVVDKKVVRDTGERAQCGRKDRITVLHLIGSLKVGGAEQQLVSIVPHFDKSKFRVVVVTMQPGGGLVKALAKTGIESVCLNFRIRTFIPSLLRFVSILRRERADILHTHMSFASFFGRLGGLCARVPIMITTDHGQDPRKKPWDIWVEWVFNRFTAARVAVTNDIAEILHTRDHTPRNKIVVIENGVDTDRFRVDKSEGLRVRKELGLSDDAIVVGTIARLTWEKGLEVLIEAISELVKTVPQLRCVIVGDGLARQDLEKCCDDFKMRDYVQFTGIRLDVPELLKSFDMFALPSKSEGMPVSVLEAMAAGTPIVSTDVGGIPGVITDHREALMVAAGDNQAFMDAMTELISNPQLAAELAGKASEKVVSQHSAAATVQKLEQVYCRLLENS